MADLTYLAITEKRDYIAVDGIERSKNYDFLYFLIFFIILRCCHLCDTYQILTEYLKKVVCDHYHLCSHLAIGAVNFCYFSVIVRSVYCICFPPHKLTTSESLKQILLVVAV